MILLEDWYTFNIINSISQVNLFPHFSCRCKTNSSPAKFAFLLLNVHTILYKIPFCCSILSFFKATMLEISLWKLDWGGSVPDFIDTMNEVFLMMHFSWILEFFTQYCDFKFPITINTLTAVTSPTEQLKGKKLWHENRCGALQLIISCSRLKCEFALCNANPNLHCVNSLSLLCYCKGLPHSTKLYCVQLRGKVMLGISLPK